MSAALVPVRMSYESCAAQASAAQKRMLRQIRREQRVVGRRKASLFKGAELSRLTMDWTATLAPADDELRWSLARLRARARDLARNNAYVRQYLNLLKVNVIGPTGMKLQAQVRNNDGNLNKLINDKIEAGWDDWAANVTIGTPLSLVRFEHQLIETFGREGEVFVRIWRGIGNAHAFALEGIDADLVDEELNRARGYRGENEIRMGIEVDIYGRPVAYHVYDSPASVIGSRPDRKRIRIPADEIIHLYHPDRVNQSRGITPLAPVMYALRMIDGMDEAELVATRAAAAKMGFFTRKAESFGGAIPEGKDGSAPQIEANAGTFGILPDGYELAQWDPQHPNAQYPEFIKTQLRKIASGLGVSYNAFANDLEGVNYSSMRSGLLIERDTWRSLQEWWISAFRTRVYREWLRMAWLVDAVTLDNREFEKFMAVKWVPRGWAWVDPLKDTQSAIEGIQSGLGSRRLALAEQGLDLEDVLEDLAEEKKLAEQYGVDISGAKAAASTTQEPDDSGDGDGRAVPSGRNRAGLGDGRLAVLLGREPHLRTAHMNGGSQ